MPEATGPVLITVDKLDKIGLAGVERALTDAGHTAEAVKALLEVLEAASVSGGRGRLAEVLPSGIDADALGELETIHAAVAEQTNAVPRIEADLTLVRGMGYYTGAIFEIDAPGLAVSIGGGGRYDGMLGRFGGEAVPACGFSLGFERLCEVLPGQASRTRPSRVALLCRPEQPVGHVLAEARKLRDGGYVVETVLVSGRAKGVYKRLAVSGFDHVADALIGDPPRPLHASE